MVPARRLARDPPRDAWALGALAGRLAELSGPGGGSCLSPAFALVWDAQRQGEPAAWIATAGGTFFPPDAADVGVDLAALAVVRAPDARRALRAAGRLVQSGGFGLVVLDLGRAPVPVPDQARLAGLADRHRVAGVCLTRKSPEAPSLGPRVSVRAEAVWERAGPGRFRCRVQTLKDRLGPAGRASAEVLRGPDGLR